MFPLVARVNRLAGNENREDLGSRTDLLFHNFRLGEEGILVEACEQAARSGTNSLKIVGLRPDTNSSSLDLYLGQIPKHLPKGFEVYFSPVSPLPSEEEIWPSFPTTGFLAIQYCLRNYDSVHLTGFSFYSGMKNYNKAKMAERKRLGKRTYFLVSGHPVQEEADFLQRQFARNHLPSKVSFDNTFERLIIRKKYKGKNKIALLVQVIINTVQGLRSRFLGPNRN